MIETILIFLVAFFVGFFFIGILLTLWVRHKMRQTHEQLGEALNKIVKDTILEHTIIMRIEHDPEHGYFAYRLPDGDFLAHGSTVEDMQKNFAERFPGKTGLVPDQEGSGSEFVKTINQGG